jgi:hypothetical protein
MAGFRSLPFGAEARRRHDEPDAVNGHECRHLFISEARGARGLRGHSHKFRESRLVGVKPSEEFL